MSPPITFAAGAGLLVAGGVFGWLLRRGWLGRAQGTPASWLAGWTVLAMAVAAAGTLLGPARGLFVASALVSLAALGVVASGLQVRARKPSRALALEPSSRPSKAWRGWLRGLLAGPIGGIAAMGVGLAYVVWTPGAPQTRMVIGGMLVPVLWATGMAWTLSDDKILRATAVLAGVAVVTFGASALRGFS